MASVAYDLIQEAVYDVEGTARKRITRSAIITGVTGNANARLAAARAELPVAGAAYPADSDLELMQVSVRPVSADKYRATLVYEVPGMSQRQQRVTEETTYEVGTVGYQTQTNKDKDDTLITVEYNGDTKSPLLSIEANEAYLIARRLEDASPLAKSLQYTNHVNSDTFGGGAIRTWRCIGITGVSNDGGSTWEVTYEFRYRADTWDVRAVYLLDDGTPPDDVDADGDKLVRVYPEIAFSGLDL